MVENSRKSNFHIGETSKLNDKQYAIATQSNLTYNKKLIGNLNNEERLKDAVKFLQTKQCPLSDSAKALIG